MNNVATLETYEPLTSEPLVVEQLPVSTKRTLPAAPFPRKYILSVFVDLQDARQAALALRAAGFDERGIHVLQHRDFVEAVAQDQSPFNLVTKNLFVELPLWYTAPRKSFHHITEMGKIRLPCITA